MVEFIILFVAFQASLIATLFALVYLLERYKLKKERKERLNERLENLNDENQM